MDKKTLWVVESRQLFIEAITRPEGGRLPTQEELYYYKLYQIQKSLDNRHIVGVLRLPGWQDESIKTSFDEIYKDR